MNAGTTTRTLDLLVVGAGPAGLASAIAAARQGLQVEVIDAMKPPIDKACGEGLMPSALAALATFGLDLTGNLSQSESALLRGIRYIGQPSTSHASSRNTVIEATFLGGPGHGIRRTVLHQLLLDRAASLGIRFQWETVVQSLAQQNDSVQLSTNRRSFNAHYLVGADGHCSRIANWANLSRSTIYSTRIGLRQHYVIAPWTDHVEVYWSDRGQAYITPVSSTTVCVAFIAYQKFNRPAEALAHFPDLARRLATAIPSSAPRGSITYGSTLHRVTSGNIALVGDASGSVDAIIGEGMALCFRQAAALAQSLRSDDLPAYQAAHRNIQRLPTLVSRSLLLMGRSPRLRACVLSAFEHNPNLFSRLLQIHAGHSSLNTFSENRLLTTGSNLLPS